MLNNQMVSNKWYLQFFSNPPGSPVAPGLRLVKGTLDRPEARPVALISRWCCHGIHPVVQLSLKMSEKWVDLGNGDYDWSTHNGDYDWLWLMADNLPGFLGMERAARLFWISRLPKILSSPKSWWVPPGHLGAQWNNGQLTSFRSWFYRIITYLYFIPIQ